MEEEPHYFFFLFRLVITHALGGSWILNPFYHLAVTREGVTYELELIGEDEPHYILFLHSTPTQHSKNGCWIPPQTTSQQCSTCTFCRWVDDTRRYDKHWVPKKTHLTRAQHYLECKWLFSIQNCIHCTKLIIKCTIENLVELVPDT